MTVSDTLWMTRITGTYYWVFAEAVVVLSCIEAARPGNAKAKSCIFLFLEGGPPHQDMWDPKPNAPSEIRGPFNPISTAVPGTIFTEHCDMSAKIADKFTVVRSHAHRINGHSTGSAPAAATSCSIQLGCSASSKATISGGRVKRQP